MQKINPDSSTDFLTYPFHMQTWVL